MKNIALFSLLLLASSPSFAEEPLRLLLQRDHQFSPARLGVPAGRKIQLVIRNESDKPIEWECEELDREEVVKPGEEGAIFLGPLSRGEYPYFDDRHQDSKGVLVVK